MIPQSLLETVKDDIKTLFEAAGGEFVEPVLAIEINRAYTLITDYCHQVVPDSVYIAYIPQMIFDLHRQYFKQGNGIQSISEEKTSITYAAIPAAGGELDIVFEPLKKQLNRHRTAFFTKPPAPQPKPQMAVLIQGYDLPARIIEI